MLIPYEKTITIKLIVCTYNISCKVVFRKRTIKILLYIRCNFAEYKEYFAKYVSHVVLVLLYLFLSHYRDFSIKVTTLPWLLSVHDYCNTDY